MASNRTRIEQLLEQFAPEIRNAFLSAVADVTATADLRNIVRALESGDLDAALRAVHLDPAAFRPLDAAMAEAFEAGGSIASQSMPTVRDSNDNRVVFRFDVRNPRAEAYLRTRSSEFVVDIIDDQRTAIRNALRAGMEEGINPRNVALDIVGRIDPATGKRAGGVIGLTSTQEEYARNYRAELLAGDAAALRRTLRDKRLDARVATAVAEGRPVDPATVEKLVTRYRASLLRLRGETIGRTEALQSLHVGQHEGYQQAIDSGALKESAIKKVWSATGDKRVRHTHKKMDGQKVPYNGTFKSPTGETLRYPGDPLASAGEIINCFPYDTEVRSSDLLSASRRWFDGFMVEVGTVDGKRLAGTPNHPVLTHRGWVALKHLNEGDYLVSCRPSDHTIAGPNVNHMVATIEQVFDALAAAGPIVRRSGSQMDFHGDGAAGDVDIVAPARSLGVSGMASVCEPIPNRLLAHADVVAPPGLSAPHHGADCSAPAATGLVGGCDLHGSTIIAHQRPLQALGIGPSTNSDLSLGKYEPDSLSRDANTLGEFFNGGAGTVEFDKFVAQAVASGTMCEAVSLANRPASYTVAFENGNNGRQTNANPLADFAASHAVSIKLDRVLFAGVIRFSGHVFNLSTGSGAYIANGIIAHNCRCAVEYRVDFLAGVK